MKLRYTSLQVDAGSAEEHDPATATDLGGMPVVVGSLHSQVPGVAAAIRAAAPDARHRLRDDRRRRAADRDLRPGRRR